LEYQSFPDDQGLLEAVSRSDEAAFDALFRTWYAPLCRYASGLTDGDLDEAEDVVQQVFIKFWEQRAGLTVHWSVKAYLYKMVHNRCLNRLRDARIRDQYKMRQAQVLENSFESAGAQVAEQEVNERLRRALTALPPQCRQVFELSRFEELKYREIADHLNISIKTVEAQMGKALRVLREHFADYLMTFLFVLLNI
jgi:RNA polymerase sigma-70 factor, ECF subfamily